MSATEGGENVYNDDASFTYKFVQKTKVGDAAEVATEITAAPCSEVVPKYISDPQQ